MTDLQTKTYAWLEAKTDGEAGSGTFSGYGSAYAVDLHGDKILPGAFAQSIRDKRGQIPLLMNHMADAVAGCTVDLAEDSKGLWVKGHLFGTTAGRDAYALLKDAAAIDFRVGMSIGFIAKDVDYDNDSRIIKQIDLWEISLTPFPAQPKAFVSDVKSLREFEQYLRDAGRYSLAESKRIVALVSACNLSAHGTSTDTNDRNQRLDAAMKGVFR